MNAAKPSKCFSFCWLCLMRTTSLLPGYSQKALLTVKQVFLLFFAFYLYEIPMFQILFWGSILFMGWPQCDRIAWRDRFLKQKNKPESVAFCKIFLGPRWLSSHKYLIGQPPVLDENGFLVLWFDGWLLQSRHFLGDHFDQSLVPFMRLVISFFSQDNDHLGDIPECKDR